MIRRDDRRLVLDAHGVVLGNPLPSFLADLARETGQASVEFRRRWHGEIRRDAWLGHIADDDLWNRLTGGVGEGRDWHRRLELRYSAGPAAAHLDRWSRLAPLWLLSNHRSAWLRPRLARFGLDGFLESILVSDEIGALKPEATAFAAALAGLERPDRALFIDDQAHNVDAARRAGLAAVRADPGDDGWVREVDEWLERGPERSSP